MGKIVKNYENFKNVETTNEELLGLDKLATGIKNLWKKGAEKIKKIKGGKEVEVIYQKYLTMITSELAKTAQIDLNVAAASKGDLPAATGATTNDANAKLAVDTLKKKKTITDQIVQKIKATALKEMDNVLKSDAMLIGGAENPQLKIIIDTKKDQFEMDYLNAQIAYLNKAGDKTMIAAISKERDALSKKIEKSTDDLGSLKSSGMNYDAIDKIYSSENKNVIFLLPGKDMKLYDPKKKLSDQSEIVGVGEIKAINDQNNDTSVTINYEDKDIKMGYGKIIGQAPEENAETGEGNTEVFKSYGVEKPEELVGKEVYYMRDGFDKNAPSADLVGKNEVTAFDAEKGLTIKGKDEKTFEKGIDQLISMEEGDKLTGNKSEEEPEESKEPAEVLAELDEDTKKNVLSYADFIKNPANKAKADRIQKIITTNAG